MTTVSFKRVQHSSKNVRGTPMFSLMRMNVWYFIHTLRPYAIIIIMIIDRAHLCIHTVICMIHQMCTLCVAIFIAIAAVTICRRKRKSKSNVEMRINANRIEFYVRHVNDESRLQNNMFQLLLFAAGCGYYRQMSLVPIFHYPIAA